MFTYDEEMTRQVLEVVLARLKDEDTPLDHAGNKKDLDDALAGLITSGGRDVTEVLDLYVNHLAPAIVSVDSPRYLAFIPAAPTKASLLFDVIVSASSLEGSSWLTSAGSIAAENQALRVLADLAGLPGHAGGVFVSGGSAGNLSALLVARDTAEHRKGIPIPGKPKAVVSDEAHSSVAKALRIIGVEAIVIATEDHRLTEADLRAGLEERDDIDSIVAVIATAGTTNAGIVDDLTGISRVAKELNAWMHVDAAYGGAALFAPSVRGKFAGIERCDSMIVDPHKWLMAPFDAAALLYRDPHLAKAVLTQDASYLDPIREDDAWNPTDYAFHLSRRSRGLPFWFSLAVNGTDAYRDAIEYSLELARRTADVIRGNPILQLVREPELSTVMFRRDGWDFQEYKRWSDELLEDQIGFVLPSSWEGTPIARLTFVNPMTTIEMVNQILETMR
jgi:glutamate/tyrosine decarboxylase-like PLP-dependent enzyme